MTKCYKWMIGIVAAVVLLVCVAALGKHWAYCHVAAGFSLTAILSLLLVGALVKEVGKTVRCSLRGSPDGPLIAALWDQDGKRRKWGDLVGLLESSIFFVAWLRPEAWAIGAGWLAFKAVVYWESTAFTKIPEGPSEDPVLIQYVMGRQALGAYHSTKLLVGTAANIVVGLVGAAFTQWLIVPVLI